MNLSVFGEYYDFTVAGLTRTHYCIRLMKLSAVVECEEWKKNQAPYKRRKIMKLKVLGENGEWHKIEHIWATHTQKIRFEIYFLESMEC